MVPESVLDIKPRYLSLLFGSLSLCVFFISETYQFISAIQNENIIEAQSHKLGPRGDASRREYMTRDVDETQHSGGGFIDQDAENSNTLMNAGVEGSVHSQDRGSGEFMNQDGDRRTAEHSVHGVEERKGDFIALGEEKRNNELMVAAIEESGLESMVQDIINGYPYNLLRDFNDHPVKLKEDGDIPLFWHIHKSGGSSMKHIFTCLRKVQTRRMNDPKICTDQEPILRICELPFGTENLGSRVINADISSIQGIERAVDLGLTTTGKFRTSADCTSDHGGKCTDQEFIVDTSRIYDSLKVFTPTKRARLFVLLRHPVERAISKYFYIKVATWERNYKPQVANMTLLEYADSKLCYNNWVTRRLVNKMEGDLTHDDLSVAKEILRRKALVLLLEDMDDAIKRLRGYFGWNESLDQEQHNCLKEFMYDNPINVNNKKGQVLAGGLEWAAVKEKNLLDLELYFYAKEIHQLQENFIFQSSSSDSKLQ